MVNIVFDLGAVLIDWDPRHLYSKVFDDAQEMEWFLANVCTSEWNLEQDRGRSFEDAIAEASARHPDYAPHIALYHTRWHEMIKGPIAGTVAILEELHEKGTPLYAITNWHGDKFRETRQRFPFLDIFRDIVVSGDEKIIKPDPTIYQRLFDRNGLKASDCFFIDDNVKNIKGAKAVGMMAHHFTTPEKLRAVLVDRGAL